MNDYVPRDRAQLVDNSDALGKALHHLRMQTALCCRSELTAPWSIEMPSLENTLMLHVVTSGNVLIEIDGEEPLSVGVGHLVLVAHGRGHRISSAPGMKSEDLFSLPVEKVSDRYEILRYGGGGERTNMICGVATFEHPVAIHLLKALPAVVHVETWNSPHGDWLQNTMSLMAIEAGSMRPGGGTIVTRLADILVIQAIRSWLDSPTHETTGWLAAMRDSSIGRAMELIHKQPENPWTVQGLAEEVAMSRSGFAARFTALLGMSPMNYVTEWRMSLATNLLKERLLSLYEISKQCGYASEAAFSRAYKRFTGVSPRKVSREMIEATPIECVLPS